MLSRHLRWTLPLLPLLFASCIDFEKQIVTGRHDRERDELRLFLVYERIHATESPTDVTDKELEQLSKLQRGRVAYFFDNWIVALDLDGFEKALREMRADLAEMDPNSEPARQLQLKLDLLQQVVDSLTIHPGRFFLNAQGELCAYQAVTIRKVSTLQEPLNRVLDLFVREQLQQQELTDDIRAMLEQAVRQRGGKWVQLEGNQLRVHWPSPPQQAADELESSRKLLADGKPTFANLLTYTAPLFTLTIGKPDAPRAQLRIDNLSEDKYHPNLIKPIRSRGLLIDQLDIDAIRSQFLKDGQLPKPAA